MDLRKVYSSEKATLARSHTDAALKAKEDAAREKEDERHRITTETEMLKQLEAVLKKDARWLLLKSGLMTTRSRPIKFLSWIPTYARETNGEGSEFFTRDEIIQKKLHSFTGWKSPYIFFYRPLRGWFAVDALRNKGFRCVTFGEGWKEMGTLTVSVVERKNDSIGPTADEAAVEIVRRLAQGSLTYTNKYSLYGWEPPSIALQRMKLIFVISCILVFVGFLVSQ